VLLLQVIAAEGEQKASRALREAANVIAESSSALQVNPIDINISMVNPIDINISMVNPIDINIIHMVNPIDINILWLIP
jgi:hypothetical protein